MSKTCEHYIKAQKPNLVRLIRQHYQKNQWRGGVNIQIGDGTNVFFLASIGDNQLNQQRMSPEVHTRIGSVTKTFTGVLTLMYAQKGLLDLNDLLVNWYPEFRNVDGADQITILNLSTMTSGLADPTNDDEVNYRQLYVNPWKIYTPDYWINETAKLPLLFPPGSEYHYSNINTCIQGRIIERISGKPLNQIMESLIFKPLNMNNTVLDPINKTPSIPEPYLHGYYDLVNGNVAGCNVDSDDPVCFTTQETTFWDMSYSYASGAIISTVSDLNKWSKALGTGSLLTKDAHSIQLHPWTSGMSGYTDNFFYGVNALYNTGVIFHTGEIPGYTTIVSYIIEEGITLVISNNHNSQSNSKFIAEFGDLWKSIIQMLFPKYKKMQ